VSRSLNVVTRVNSAGSERRPPSYQCRETLQMGLMQRSGLRGTEQHLPPIRARGGHIKIEHGGDDLASLTPPASVVAAAQLAFCVAIDELTRDCPGCQQRCSMSSNHAAGTHGGPDAVCVLGRFLLLVEVGAITPKLGNVTPPDSRPSFLLGRTTPQRRGAVRMDAADRARRDWMNAFGATRQALRSGVNPGGVSVEDPLYDRCERSRRGTLGIRAVGDLAPAP